MAHSPIWIYKWNNSFISLLIFIENYVSGIATDIIRDEIINQKKHSFCPHEAYFLEKLNKMSKIFRRFYKKPWK